MTIIPIKRKPRPLRKTYDPTNPYVVVRNDLDSGTITYEIWDERQDSYRYVCAVSDDYGHNGYAKWDAEQIAKGLNMLVAYKLEQLPKVKDPDDVRPSDDDDDEGPDY